ncbi:hypothetical protein OZX62_01545 [Bifidobacterium sp. ESL0690]|uniref:hypothetical protein n=1 Tax=Bifidobacterium sp. ESL0690 TaxID=2983214 RepID=UPI0023F70186|nr:hypothetical protein [Bifidobacterium sp. ESL0690]WEV47009.1 hypothetical protein OZX62_01545 [Bifidobacterium sp. ESL0690]
MRQPLLYIDRGNGWENMTGREGSHVALDGFTVEWGTNDPAKQPDCNVLKFKLVDRDGKLAGNSTRLAGAKVLVQLSRMPLWKDLTIDNRWAEEPDETIWASLHLENAPDVYAAPDPTALSIFEGNIATGCSIEQRSNNTYLLTLNANSRTVRMSRTTAQGPVSGDPKYAGQHWVGNLQQRVDEVNRRLGQIDAPQLSAEASGWLKSLTVSLASYDQSSFPDLSTVLYAIASWSPELPVYYERHKHGGTMLDILHAGAKAGITLHADGSLTVSDGWREDKVIVGEKVRIDAATLRLPDPVSQIAIKGKKAAWEKTDSKITFGDAEADITGGLPGNLTETIRSATFETDAVLADESEGNWGGNAYRPSEAERRQWVAWLQAATMRLRPEKLTASTEKIDIDDHEQTFQPSATLWAFVRNRYTSLLSEDGTPATSGAWLGIGGTLTFKWRHGKPVFDNEMELQPLPPMPTTLATWGALNPITLKWADLSFTWGEFGQITDFKE